MKLAVGFGDRIGDLIGRGIGLSHLYRDVIHRWLAGQSAALIHATPLPTDANALRDHLAQPTG